MMVRKSLWILCILVLTVSLGLFFTGCSKTKIKKDDPAITSREEAAKTEQRDKERQRESEERRKAEQAAADAKVREEERRREEASARDKERERDRDKEREKKDFEKSIVATKTPGIEGQVFESSLLKDVLFDYDRYDVRQQDVEILRQNADLLLKNPNVKIQVEGHCDERGTVEYNLALGERRASSVKKFFSSLGVSPDRITTISYGKERPLDPGHNEVAWGKNRRAHFVILSK